MRAILPPVDFQRPIPQIGDLPDPVPGPDEVLVDVRAAGLNHADLLQLRGNYPPPPGESEVPGLEAAGVVAAEAGGFRRGDRVMALLAGGGHGTRAAIPAGQMMPLPEGLTFEQGAAIPEAALTAWTNLVAEGGLQPGETVLITGATGGMGSFAAQLARELGGRVLASGRDPERLARLAQLGIESTVLEREDLPRQVRERTEGKGADLVFDLTGGVHLGSHLAALRDRGRLVLVGLLAGGKAELELHPILRRRLRIVGSVLRTRPRAEKAALVAAFAEFALPLLAAGKLRAVVDRVVPFESAAQAYAALAQGGALGKIVLSMPEAPS